MLAPTSKIAASLAIGAALLASAAHADRATTKGEIVSYEGGDVLIDEAASVVLEEVSPTGEHMVVPAAKREIVDIDVYTSDELAPKALVNVTIREKVTQISMTREGVLNTGRPVSASAGTVEAVDPTNLISLEAEDEDKAHGFGSTVNSGDLYFAQNGDVYQYIGTLDAR